MKLFVLASFLLFSFSCTSISKHEKVGIAFSSRPDVLNSVGLRERWNQLLTSSKDSCHLDPVIIRQTSDVENGERYYYLSATTPDKKIAMAQLLKRKNRDLLIDDTCPEIIVCDCYDYVPKRENGKWICYSIEGAQDCQPEILVDLSDKKNN